MKHDEAMNGTRTIFQERRKLIALVFLIIFFQGLRFLLDAQYIWAGLFMVAGVLGSIALRIYWKDAEPQVLQQIAQQYNLTVHQTPSVPDAWRETVLMTTLRPRKMYTAEGTIEGHAVVLGFVMGTHEKRSLLSRKVEWREDFYIGIRIAQDIGGWLVVDQGIRDIQNMGTRVQLESNDLHKKVSVLVSNPPLAPHILDPNAMALLLDWEFLPDVEIRDSLVLLRLEISRYQHRKLDFHIHNALRLAAQVERNV